MYKYSSAPTVHILIGYTYPCEDSSLTLCWKGSTQQLSHHASPYINLWFSVEWWNFQLPNESQLLRGDQSAISLAMAMRFLVTVLAEGNVVGKAYNWGRFGSTMITDFVSGCASIRERSCRGRITNTALLNRPYGAKLPPLIELQTSQHNIIIWIKNSTCRLYF